MKKYIFIIDLDNTLIGNCEYQIALFSKHNFIKKYKGPNININKTLAPYYNQNNKLLRPHFIYFMNKMKEMYNANVSFYIYTASTKNWANTQIKIIEKENKIKFNRPIFTRTDCFCNEKINNGFKKSINKILPRLKATKESDIIIIDDSDVFLDYTEYHIKCNAYNFTLFSDNNYHLSSIYHEDLTRGMTCPYNHNDCSIKNKMKLYKWLYKTIIDINKFNEKYKSDKFWLNLANAIEANKITNYSPDVIKQLTKIANHNN
jgi:hypothetical protein|uniref:FCP1 homology domain-containing protein n=1 Tax=viral metagenome TaxID=1070528 RepID=A0A6C0LHI3_9ZZZZ